MCSTPRIPKPRPPAPPPPPPEDSAAIEQGSPENANSKSKRNSRNSLRIDLDPASSLRRNSLRISGPTGNGVNVPNS